MGNARGRHRVARSSGNLLTAAILLENSSSTYYLLENMETPRHAIHTGEIPTEHVFGALSSAKQILEQTVIDDHQ